MDWDFICLTIDVEWVHPEVLAYVVGLLDARSIPATFFCTHAGICVPGHERALHPNFRRRGDTLRQFRESLGPGAAPADEATIYEHVIKTTMAFCPEGVGIRSHSLFYDSELLPVFARYGIEYHSGCFLPGATGLVPSLREYGILELPICYMDHHDLMVGMTDFRVSNLKLDEPGLKVLAFHPNMIFINAVDEGHYAETKSFYHDGGRLTAARSPGRGVGTLFEEVLDHIATSRAPTARLGDINRAWRDGARAPGSSGEHDGMLLSSPPRRPFPA